MSNPLYTEPVPATDLVVGARYRGNSSSFDLDGIEFTVDTIAYDIDAETGNDLIVLDVTIGSGEEVMTDILTPADATFTRVAPEEN